jgi:hypothetical protein
LWALLPDLRIVFGYALAFTPARYAELPPLLFGVLHQDSAVSLEPSSGLGIALDLNREKFRLRRHMASRFARTTLRHWPRISGERLSCLVVYLDHGIFLSSMTGGEWFEWAYFAPFRGRSCL